MPSATRPSSKAPSASAGIGLILKALEFAARKHRDQRLKDKQASPYINHPNRSGQRGKRAG